ncbi:MAG: D-alanyl-D-alanine carboxypeptidase, partial [Firmicutes bacterium]|nr:D-alanyl-D-alanine carboxypeptidase [Bacillota bacterium]
MPKAKRMRAMSILLSVAVLITILSAPGVSAQEVKAGDPAQGAGGATVAAVSAILIDVTTGRVLFEQNPDQRLAPASLTKIMTVALALEAVNDGKVGLNDPVTVSQNAVKLGGSTMFLEAGMKVPLLELLKGVTVVSGNDASTAVAEYVAGSEEFFIQLMNRRAAELGLSNTHFTNSHGLDQENHYSSARDLATLTAYADRTFPLFVELHAMREMTFNKITQPNRNGLLAAYPGADGVKTGMTNQAGYSLVASAGREGMRLIAVILKAEGATVREAEATKLLNYGFRNFETVKVLSKGDDLGEVQVRSGKEETVGLVAEETLV